MVGAVVLSLVKAIDRNKYFQPGGWSIDLMEMMANARLTRKGRSCTTTD